MARKRLFRGMSEKTLKIGTRGSPLALAQAHEVRDKLVARGAGPACEIVVIATTGDQILDRRLSEVGGKGLFTREIQQALIGGRIDLAVHSMKDVETWLPEETEIAAVLEREDVRDAFICATAGSLDDLAEGAVVGTSSLRRQAQILHRRPDLRVETLRGNVQTRLKRLAEGRVDATLLAMAGLNRLGKADAAAGPIPPDVMLPAVAQGAIGIEVRRGDDRVCARVTLLDHAPSSTRVTAERAMLAALDGSCHTPIAGLAVLDGESGITITGLVARPDGSEMHQAVRSGDVDGAAALGDALGRELRSRMPADFFALEPGGEA